VGPAGCPGQAAQLAVPAGVVLGDLEAEVLELGEVLEQRAELVGCHSDGLQDAAHATRKQVFTAVNGHDGGTPVRVAHHMVTAIYPGDGETDALERLDNLGSGRNWDVARHKAASYQKSGYVERQSQLVWWANLFKQQFQASTQVRDCFLSRGPLAERGDICPQVGGRIPASAVLFLLDDVGHVNDTSHTVSMSCDPESSTAIHSDPESRPAGQISRRLGTS